MNILIELFKNHNLQFLRVEVHFFKGGIVPLKLFGVLEMLEIFKICIM